MSGAARQVRLAWKRATVGWRQRVIDRTPERLRSALTPAAAYFDMLFVDHGLFRLLYLNRHNLSDKVARSAQPGPYDISRFARRGVRTIVNLRGSRELGSYWLEERACERNGLKLVNFIVRSRAAPSLDEVRGAKALFDSVEYPMVLHCKSGADRAGLMSVLYRHFKEGVPLDKAKEELSLKYGHFRSADTGILDYFFERYLADNAKKPMPFMEWVETVYDPDELKQTFQANGWVTRFVASVLRRE